jgi:hypothetical protein
LLEKKIKNYDLLLSNSLPVSIDIKKAIKYVATALGNVTPTTIINCWKKTGILPLENESSNNEIENSSNIIEEISNQERIVIENLINKFSPTSPLGAEEYITIDNEGVSNEMITDEEIIASFKPIEEEVVVENKLTIPKVSIKDAVNALETAYNFLQQGDIEIDYIESKSFKSLKRKISLLNIQNQKQANIETYFK